MVLPVGGRKPGIPDRTGFELNALFSGFDAFKTRMDPLTDGSDNQRPTVLDGAMAWEYPSRKSINILNKGATPGTNARQALLDAISDANPGQVIYIPAGEWPLLVSGTYNKVATIATSGVRIVGDGDATRLTYLSGVETGTRLLSVEADGFEIEGVTFDLTNPDTGLRLTDGIGLELNGASNVQVLHCGAITPASGGIHIRGDVNDLWVDTYRVRGAGYGLLTQQDATGSNWSLTNIDGDGQGGVGSTIQINIPSGELDGLEILHANVRNYITSGLTGGTGIGLVNVNQFIVSDVIGTNCGRNVVHVEDGSDNGVISHVVARDCGHAGIEVQSISGGACTHIVIDACDVAGCCTAEPNSEHRIGYGGIEVTTNASVVSRYIRITNCISRDNDQAGFATYEMRNSMVYGNRAMNNGGAGFTMTSPADTKVFRNETSGNTTAGLVTSGTGSGARIEDNDFADSTPVTNGFSPAATSWARNEGYVTENQGTATVANGATSTNVSHGLAVTPAAKNISITPTNVPTNDVRWAVTSTSSSTFTITLSGDPGASGATFAWKAEYRP